jgi:thiamine pyrophosphokinase
MKTAALFLNGDAPEPVALQRAFSYNPNFKLCTDGAYHYLKLLDIHVDTIIGDMDSLDEVPKNAELICIEDQNTTDFEKALEHLSKLNYERVVVLGSTGGQNDHFLGNLNAAYKYHKKLNILFFDNSQHFFLTEKSIEFPTEIGQIVSLVPFPEAHIIRMDGLQYSLENETLNLLKRVGTRNRATGKRVKIELSGGALWIFISY